MMAPDYSTETFKDSTRWKVVTRKASRLGQARCWVGKFTTGAEGIPGDHTRSLPRLVRPLQGRGPILLFPGALPPAIKWRPSRARVRPEAATYVSLIQVTELHAGFNRLRSTVGRMQLSR